MSTPQQRTVERGEMRLTPLVAVAGIVWFAVTVLLPAAVVLGAIPRNGCTIGLGIFGFLLLVSDVTVDVVEKYGSSIVAKLKRDHALSIG
jgi:hypothetical protein